MSESAKHRIYMALALVLFLLASHLDYVWSVPQ